jgi:hypothetical protein
MSKHTATVQAQCFKIIVLNKSLYYIIGHSFGCHLSVYIYCYFYVCLIVNITTFKIKLIVSIKNHNHTSCLQFSTFITFC